MDLYTLIIDAYGRMGLIDCAFDVLKYMLDAGCQPSHHTYCSLIKHLSHQNLVKTNDGMVSRFSSTGIPNIWKTMDFKIALELFERIVGHGCAPNLNTYRELITGLCKERNLEVAQSLSMGMSPSEDIYNALLNCCCELQLYGKAVELVDTMIEHGFLPALESCKMLLCGLLDEENSAKAYSVFRRMLCCGYNYDEIAWKVLLDGCVKRGHLNSCSELLSIMEKMDCQLHPESYSMLIQGLFGT